MASAQELTRQLRGNWSGQRGTAFCPAHENTRTPALSIAEGEAGKLLLYCFAGCSYADIRGALRDMGSLEHLDPSPTERNAPAPKRTCDASQSSFARKIWEQARPIVGTLAETYLRHRGITTGFSSCLRFHPECPHGPSGAWARLPAMIARVDGSEAFAIHRTYLRPDGEAKADIKPAKMALGPCRGGAVRLVEVPDTPLVVAEGIETALSLASGLLPYPISVWAALSASNMATIALPATPKHLIVAMDGDPAGIKAGRNLAERAHVDGWRVELHEAPPTQDWNDVLIERTVFNG